jgi:hypothetical protein
MSILSQELGIEVDTEECRGVTLTLLRNLNDHAKELTLYKKKDNGFVKMNWPIGAVCDALIGSRELSFPQCKWAKTDLDGSTASKFSVEETLTGSDRCSLIDLLKNRYHTIRHPKLFVTYDEGVGEKANLFLSYDAEMSLSDIIGAIECFIKNHSLNEKDLFLWFDPLINNLWLRDKDKKSFLWWSTS